MLFLCWCCSTENCSYKCSEYFEPIPIEEPVRIYGEKSTGHIFIAGNDDARQVEIYVPSKSKAANEVTITSNKELKTTKTYTKIKKKAKLVKFSDFKKTDPVLSSFNDDLKEPYVPQKICQLRTFMMASFDGLIVDVNAYFSES